MKTVLLILAAIVSFISFGCNKDNPKMVFKAKYIGQDCAPVIQILEPLDEKFKESDYLFRSTECNYCVAVGELPEKYKNEQPFYFTIKQIKETKYFDKLTNCGYPKYIIDIQNFSDTLFTD